MSSTPAQGIRGHRRSVFLYVFSPASRSSTATKLDEEPASKVRATTVAGDWVDGAAFMHVNEQ